DVAPKGFFADLPQPAAPATSSTDVAPKGFFADLPQPAAPAAPGAAPTGRHERSASIDLDGLDLGPASDGGLELEPAVASARQAAAAPAARTPPSTNPPPLELGDDGLGLDGLDLPSPSTGAAAAAGASRGVVSFKPASSDEVGRSGAAVGAPGEIDLAVPSRREPAAKEARPAARAATRTDDAPRLSRKLQRVLLIAALALAAVGAGGYLYYQRWQGQQQRAADIRASLDTARQAMTDGNKNGWGRAVAAARQVIALDPRNAEALGLAAQALLAAILDDGAQAEARRAEALRHLQAVPAGAGRTPAVERAQALDLVLDGDLAAASARLEPLAARGDGLAQLFLGWARLAAEDWDGARAAFEAAGAALPRLTATTRLGAARALLGKGEREAARAAFLEVIAADKEHVGALVGEAEAMPPHEFVQRENALLAILQRKGIEAADPRVVARAWALAGDDAARAGRLDAARERYRRALTVLATDVGALVSAAALELRDGKLDEAATQIEKAIGLAPASVRANLVAAELDLARSRLADAAQRLAALRARTPPLAGDELGRLHLIDGMRLEAEQQPDAALAAYAEAARVLGTDALEPAIAAAMLLGRMAGAARAAKDEVRAKALEAQASERLERLAAEAEADPTLAVTLGVTYLAAGAAADSERWLRKALARRPRDVEATFQLAEALRRQGKQDEALATLVKAFELDPTRIDLGVELARGFEAAGEDVRAAELFRRLVAVPTATLDVRLRAGRFFARVRDVEAARKQGELILEVDPASATGLFLRAEGLLADGNLDEARTLLQRAVKADPDPQFLDGLGRACEALAARSGDTARRDEALTAYVQASDLDPKMLNPRLGRGRLHMERNEHGKALAAFQEALELAPAEPSIPYGIGMAYAELNDRARAVEWLTRAVRAKARADAYYRLGVIHFDMENSGAAAAALARATELGLADERALGVTVPWLTDAYWLLGTAERARASDGAKCRAWRAYLERNPTNRVQADEVRREMLGCR
ncbi:MAG: tetratricopeptide repeat protein, partial [Myxococcales bacterium]|nr:tetratricopeptide repeat protein [Myxococcales bacterium]